MKAAPLMRAFARASSTAEPSSRGADLQYLLAHTGQHYDPSMSAEFFRELGIPEPDYNLGVGSGSHGYQIGRTMIEIEIVLEKEPLDWLVVVGDVNATLATSVVGRKHGIRVAHVEAGLRSFDWNMPEEINRVVTDRLSNVLFTTDHIADENLRREGVDEEVICRVGNIMIDTLEHERANAAALDVAEVIERNRLGEGPGERHGMPEGSRLEGDYAVLTMHRPANVDSAAGWRPLLDALDEIASVMPLVFPVHPRTRSRLEEFQLWNALAQHRGLVLLRPLSYRDLLRLNMTARVVLTDSGGLQEETTVLGTPCLTLRENTERPITLRENGGTNQLVGSDPGRIRRAFREALTMVRSPHRPDLWDGHAADRIVARLLAA